MWCTPGLHNKIPDLNIFARGWVAQKSLVYRQRLIFSRGWVRKDGNLATETGCRPESENKIIPFFCECLTMQSSSHNFSPPPDLALWQLLFPHVLFSGVYVLYIYIYIYTHIHLSLSIYISLSLSLSLSLYIYIYIGPLRVFVHRKR